MDAQPNDTERTETDERIAEFREGAVIVPATRDADETEPTGLPPGHGADQRSPLDAVMPDAPGG
jgi:hypothetical protein